MEKKTVSGVGVICTDVRCCKCNRSIGAMFPEYVDDETGKPEGPFPRIKITVCREQRSTGKYINQTVIKSSSREEATNIMNLINKDYMPKPAPKKNDAMTYYAKKAAEEAVEKTSASYELKLRKLEVENEQARNRITSSSSLQADWKYEPERIFVTKDSEFGTVHTIQPHEIKDGSHSMEQTEFNFAAHQLVRLIGNDNKSITQVDVYHSPSIEKRWLNKRREFANKLRIHVDAVETVWVFHGTDYQIMTSICENGFRVARGNNEIVNGAVHGFGVYTASGPDTPLIYSKRRGTTGAILSLGLIGIEGRLPRPNSEAQFGVDTWKPKGDWIVFAHEDQLLPKYIIHY